MNNLEKLLFRNYSEVMEREECIDSVLDYLSAHDSVIGENVCFIKGLTKVGEYVATEVPELPLEFYEKLYRFNIEGASLIDFDNCESHLYKLMFNHFYCHAGYIAQKIFKIIGETDWAEKAYEDNIISAEHSMRIIELKHAACSYSHAGEAAKSVFEKTDDIEWCKKWYISKKNSGKLYLDSDKKSSSYSFSHAGDAAGKIYKLTKNIHYIEIAYNNKIHAAKIYKGTTDPNLINNYFYAAKIAALLFKNTDNKKWAKAGIDNFNQYLKICKNLKDIPDNLKEEAYNKMDMLKYSVKKQRPKRCDIRYNEYLSRKRMLRYV
jgi:hypothetical protein